MRKPVSLSAAIVLLAAGFAVASIATGGSLAAVAHAWTTLTGTTPTVTATTTSTTGRGVEVCVRFRHGRHRFSERTIVVDFHALRHLLRHGGHLGPCFVPSRHHHGHHGFKFGDGSQNVTTTTTVATTTVGPTGPSGFVGKGTTGRHGDDGADDDNNGRGGKGDGNGGGWNSLVPSFGHHGGHHH